MVKICLLGILAALTTTDEIKELLQTKAISGNQTKNGLYWYMQESLPIHHVRNTAY
jgi:hypothetical protein